MVIKSKIILMDQNSQIKSKISLMDQNSPNPKKSEKNPDVWPIELISDAGTKEIVQLFANNSHMKDYSDFLNKMFPIETTANSKPITHYFGKGYDPNASKIDIKSKWSKSDL